MFKCIQNWKDKRLKKRIERIFNNNVLDCNINVKGYVAAVGADETAWWRIDGTMEDKKPNQSFGGGSIPNDSHKEFEQETTFK